MSSKFGCYVFNEQKVFAFLDNYKYIIAILGFIIGLIMCFFGRVLIKLVLFFVSFIFVIAACCILFYIFFFSPTLSKALVWSMFTLFVIFGGIVGYFMY